MNSSTTSCEIFDTLVAKAKKANPSFIGDGIVDITDETIKELGISPDVFIPDVMDYAESKGYELRVVMDTAEGDTIESYFMITDPITFYKPETLYKICEKIENGKGTMYLITEVYSNAQFNSGLILFDIPGDEFKKYSLLFDPEKRNKTLTALHPGIIREDGPLINLNALRQSVYVPESDSLLWLFKEGYNSDFTQPKLPVIKLSEKINILTSLLQ